MHEPHKKLSSTAEQVHRYISQPPTLLAEDQRSSRVTVTRTGTFSDPRYGTFEISEQMLSDMVRNFQEQAYGQDIFIDVDHNPGNGAAGKITALTIDNGRLRADVDWTDYGVDAIQGRGFAYLSAEYHENFRDNETGKIHGPVLMGAALTTRPVIKRLDPVQLSDEFTGGNPTGLHPRLLKQLSEKAGNAMNELLKKFREQLEGFKLSEEVIKGILAAYEAGLKIAGEDEAAQKALTTQYETMGKQLAEAVATPGAQITLQFPEPPKPTDPEKDPKSLSQDASPTPDKKLPESPMKVLSEEDIKRIFKEQEEAKAASEKQLAEAKAANRKLFSDTIQAADGLDDEIKKQLAEGVDLISAEMNEATVKAMATQQLKLGEAAMANQKLAQMGYQRSGTTQVSITVDESNKIKELQEHADRRLGYLDMPDTRRFQRTGGALPEENKKLAEKVLAAFDQLHGPQLHREHAQMKKLAAGDGVITDVEVPEIWERTVIREALYQLIALQFVDSGVDVFAAVYQIPYSYRDDTAATLANTRIYEGQSIARAGVIQTTETAYPLPQKLAFEVSDELRYLAGGQLLDWDAVGENTRNAVRIVGEDTEARIFNEHLQASDEYLAVAVASENLQPQADDTLRVLLLANWPIVRPRKVFDMQGNQIGNTVNPITVTYNAVQLSEYDGTGTQPGGNYYVLNYNLGEIYLVDETGAIQTPASANAYTISYSYVTNTHKFDTDLGTAKAEDHWDTFLYWFGRRKTIIEDDRYHMTNFSLMSGTVKNQIEQAKSFAANFMRPGTNLGTDGNLGRIKDVPCFKTSAPGLWMGDQRMIIGERFQTRYRLVKPWMMGRDGKPEGS